MSEARLKGLTVTLNARLTALRRKLEHCPEEALREELALIAALLDTAREEIGPERVARQAGAAGELLGKFGRAEIEPLAGYALWAENYHEQADNPLTALEDDVFGRLLGDVAGLRVLDVGCGTGRHALELARRGARVTGADPCAEMLAVARELAAQEGLAVEWLPVGWEALPCEAPFDLVICNLVLCHVADLAGAVAAMAACLRPGGRLVLTDLHYFCLLIGWRTTFVHGGWEYAITNYLHPVSEYFAALREAGLTLEAIEDIVIEERLRGRGMDSVVDKWEGFPFGIALAARKG
jgi:malonyl-CoA O-methyltransferase